MYARTANALSIAINKTTCRRCCQYWRMRHVTTDTTTSCHYMWKLHGVTCESYNYMPLHVKALYVSSDLFYICRHRYSSAMNNDGYRNTTLLTCCLALANTFLNLGGFSGDLRSHVLISINSGRLGNICQRILGVNCGGHCIQSDVDYNR